MKTIFLLFSFLTSTLFFTNSAHAEVKLEKIKLPKGFKISIYAKEVGGARSLTWGDNDVLFVGSRDVGKVYAVEPNGKVHVLASGLNQPNGVAFANGTLYVAEIHRLIKFENIMKNLAKPPPPKEVQKFPSDKHHGWKFIAIGPDKQLYVPQGVPCNICEYKDPYGTIIKMKLDGSNETVVVRGMRNTVGFDWHPITKELWFTDNGRDWLGEDTPPDELNRVTKAGSHFGFPFCHGTDILDPEFGKGKKCSDYVAPVQNLGPHVAALGMRFYTGKTFPKNGAQQIFIAEHGSWNRSKPIGYRVMRVSLDEKGKSLGYEVFAEGWLDGGSPWGRPADVLNAKDGSLLVSDDLAGVIYKISY